MYVSFNNWLVGATVTANTVGAINAEGMTVLGGVDPCAVPDVAGSLMFWFGGVRRCRCWGVFDYRGISKSFTLRLRNGGGGGGGGIVHTAVVALNYGTYGSTGACPANEFAPDIFDVDADEVELVFTSYASLANFCQFGRIWVGDALPCTKADALQMTIGDTTTIELSGTGEEFFTENRGAYEISVGRIELTDNLAAGTAATDGDYEDFIDDLTVGWREAAVFAQTELLYAFHGRIASANITKEAGVTYAITNFNLKGF